MGYVAAGKDGRGHNVYRHPEAGRISFAATPRTVHSGNDTIREARRKIRQATNIGHAFADHLCALYAIPATGEARVEGGMSAAADDWIADGNVAARGHTPKTVVTSARAAGRIEPVVRGTRNRTGVWMIRGRDYLATNGTAPPDAGFVCTTHDIDESGGVAQDLEDAGIGNAPPSADLERWITTGIAADLAERDERIAVAVAMLADARADLDRVTAAVDEAAAILDGTATPDPKGPDDTSPPTR